MVEKYTRGSEWRKWDLHVHTPCSVLNNGFANNWDEYAKALFCKAIEKDIVCIGVTDYFSIEGYKKLRLDYLENVEKLRELFADEIAVDSEFLAKISRILVLPNIELRLDNIITTERAKKDKGFQSIKNVKLEYHLLLSDQLSIAQIEDNILAQLYFASSCSVQLGTDKVSLTRGNLERLGAKLKAEQAEFVDKSDYYVGCMCASIEFSSLSEVIKKNNNDLLNKVLFVLAEDDISKYSWDGSAHQVRKNIYANSHLIFSANEKTIQWGLSDKTKEEFSSYKGCIWGSDAHNLSDLFMPAHNHVCWIKADPTFHGLIQVAIQPHDRTFIGSIPPTLSILESNKNHYIDSVVIKRNQNAKNPEIWFDTNLLLNSGLVAIIGNKGSGKSALSDIIGFLCHSSAIGNASFLCKDRFQREDRKYANDYNGSVIWWDGHELHEPSLYAVDDDSIMEYVKYLPQKYIESVCNNLDNEFQQEINRVIFSYIDRAERGNASNLDELIETKSSYLRSQILIEQQKIEPINRRLIALEDKIVPSYKKECQKRLKQLEEELKRLVDNKPIVVDPPSKTEDAENAKKLLGIDSAIAKIEEEIKGISVRLGEIVVITDEITEIFAQVTSMETAIHEVNKRYFDFSSKYDLNSVDELLSLVVMKKPLLEFQTALKVEKSALVPRIKEVTEEIDWSDEEQVTRLQEQYKNSLIFSKQKLAQEKNAYISTTSQEQQRYQKYKDDLKDWNKKKDSLIGDSKSENTIEYYKEQIRYVDEEIEAEIKRLDTQRLEHIKNIHHFLKKTSAILNDIYQPVQHKLGNILRDKDDIIEFSAEISARRSLASELVNLVNKNVRSSLRTLPVAAAYFDELVRSTNFDNTDDLELFYNRIIDKIREEPEQISKVVPDRSVFYAYLSELKYLSVEYALKMGNKRIVDLSPGERGLVLLVFYLALSKDDIPLIIDQPEDNLDNQSVFNRLVPCFLDAKKHRQVIIVTHNPNIAVACDAEQIIYCGIDKEKMQITYMSGSIENNKIRNRVVDVLEGTEPAFDLRKSKYFFDLTQHPML